jgi:hypothetical protein
MSGRPVHGPLDVCPPCESEFGNKMHESHDIRYALFPRLDGQVLSIAIKVKSKSLDCFTVLSHFTLLKEHCRNP